MTKENIKIDSRLLMLLKATNKRQDLKENEQLKVEVEQLYKSIEEKNILISEIQLELS